MSLRMQNLSNNVYVMCHERRKNTTTTITHEKYKNLIYVIVYFGISKNPFMSQINEPINPITRAIYILVSKELQVRYNLLLVIKSNLVIYLQI